MCVCVSDSTPRIHSEAKSCLACYMYTSCGGRPACIASFPGLPYPQFLVVYSDQNLWYRRPGNEATHAVIVD